MAAPVQDCIFVLGDSLTEMGGEMGGYVQRLSDRYARKLDVLNRGFGGYNTDHAIPILEQCLAKRDQQAYAPKIRLMTIWFGANDACPLPSVQHVPLERYKTNLVDVINLIKSPESPYYSPDTRLILMTPPPVNEEQWEAITTSWDQPKPLDRFTEVTAKYAQVVRDVGKELKVPVTDVFTTLWETVGRDQKELRQYMLDGLHLNAAGYTIVFEELMKTINIEYPQLHPSRLQTVFISWDSIDPNNIRASLQKRSIDG